jgi:hypothetical protein
VGAESMKNVSTDATVHRTFSGWINSNSKLSTRSSAQHQAQVLRAHLLATESIFSHSSAPTTNSIAPPSATGTTFLFLSSANAIALRSQEGLPPAHSTHIHGERFVLCAASLDEVPIPRRNFEPFFANKTKR